MMQNSIVIATPKTTCIKILKHISALHQLNTVSDHEYLHLVSLSQEMMKTKNASAMMDYVLSLYENNQSAYQLGKIIDEILNTQKETQND